MALQDRIGVTTVQGMTGGVPIPVDIGGAPFPLPAGAALILELDQLSIRMEPGDVMVITTQTASGSSVANVAFSLLEE